MRHQNFEMPNLLANKVERLERELYSSRRVVIELMPSELQKILKSYCKCETRDISHGWLENAVEEVIKHAQVFPEASYFSTRAYCPLCEGGSSSEAGYSVPEGLRRHLIGWGSAHQCEVMMSAYQLAQEYWNHKFKASEQIEESEIAACLEMRKTKETLYCIAPDKEPKLIDDGLFLSIETPRNSKEMIWAEQRLTDLDFQISCDKHVKSYTREYENFIVYADPRRNKKIEFTVFNKSPAKAARRIRRRTTYFYLLDSWNKDVRVKYEARLTLAISDLE